MRWLVLSMLALACASGCEKNVPFELTKPASFGPARATPVTSLDGGLAALDAQVRPPANDDAAAVSNQPVEAFTKARLLKAIADCSLARYRDFAERAAALRDATALFAASPSAELRAAAQASWRLAMSSWQVDELFRFGPAGPASEPGGKDYRNAIYFFPDVNNCQVDQQLVSRGYASTPLNLSVGAKGLGALEYLLFYTGPSNSCSPGQTLNTGSPSPWAKLAPDELERRRAEYASAVAADLSVLAKTVLDAWEPSVGGFYTQFSAAGTPASSAFPTDQAAFNVLDHAFFYVDKELKDFKIALPAGLSLDCPASTCPEAVESRFSQASNQNISDNLRGFRLLYQGCGPSYSGLGFDDYLVESGKRDLAARISAAAAAAEASADTLPLPLEPLLQADRARVVALHTAVKELSDLLKTEFASSLNLELPGAGPGDND
ncbi:MAG: putative Iron-regulated protein precursor [Myxococcaceae bacterium]|nr:putative Iron-regulated protein precursor [Myxococcaceae bacterium]